MFRSAATLFSSLFSSHVTREVLALLALGYVLVGILQHSLTERLQLPSFGLFLPRLLVNIILVLGPFLIFRLLLGLRTAAALAFTCVVALAVVNRIKILNLREPALFLDLLALRTNAALVAKYLSPVSILLVVSALVGTLWVALRRRRSPITRAKLAGTGLLAAFFLVFVLEGLGKFTLFSAGLTFVGGSLKSAQDFGYALTQVAGLKNIQLPRPSGYRQEQIEAILADGEPGGAPSHFGSLPAHGRRNVVLILLESLWDPFEAAVPYHRDFLPFYRQLKRRAESRVYQSPVFGGGTANAEFEVLTGLRAASLPPGTFPYTQYLHRPTPSAVQWFRKSGYRTTAIHANTKSFWSRDIAYPFLGFDEFLGIEELEPLLHGKEAEPDDAIFRTSLERLARSADQPQFHFLITIGTHGPYGCAPELTGKWYRRDSDSYAARDIECKMNAYAEKANRLDGQLRSYFRALRKLPSPPMVILFGDHLPSFASELSDQGLTKKSLSLHRIEAIFWNSPRDAGRTPAQAGARQSLACLSPELLKRSGMSLSPFYRFVARQCLAPDSDAEEPAPRATESVLAFDRLLGELYSASPGFALHP